MFLLFYETCINYTIIQFLIWNVNFSNIYIDISKKIKLEKILSDIIFIQNDESFNIRINICKILNNHATLFQSSIRTNYAVEDTRSSTSAFHDPSNEPFSARRE